MFEQILAYTFIALFSGIVLFGHAMLFRDIFFAGSSAETSARPSDTVESDSDMRKAA